MVRISATLAVVGILLCGCSASSDDGATLRSQDQYSENVSEEFNESGPTIDLDEPSLVDTGATTLQPNTNPSNSAALPRNDLLPAYQLIVAYLSQALSANPGLRKSVTDFETVANCMLQVGYQLNGISTSGITSTTNSPPEALISPMLMYLTETCSGIPSSEWSRE